MRATCWIACLLLFHNSIGWSRAQAEDGNSPSRREAYTTLLYGDDFLLGVRVLGQSLKATNTTRDMVAVVVGDHVSAHSKAILKADGWKVQQVNAIENPGLWTGTKKGSFPPRFWAVYTKLLVFNLTQYDTVVYMDADTIALQNLDALFACDGLCGVMRHSERLNSGVMVVQPDRALFDDMLARIAETPSYTGGDQGFLNSYFSGFAASPLFVPGNGSRRLSELDGAGRGGAGTSGGLAGGVLLGRLPTEYNADLGLYILNSNRWMVEEEQLQVLHYTLSSFKPWNWWSSWIIGDTMERWQELRRRLSPPATYGGTLSLMALAAAPCLAVSLLLRHCWALALCARVIGGGVPIVCGGSSRSGLTSRRTLSGSGFGFERDVAVPGCVAWLTVAVAPVCLLGSLALALVVVPAQAPPGWGWLLAYEWTGLGLVYSFGAWLWALGLAGRARRAAGVDSPVAAGSSPDAGPRIGSLVIPVRVWSQTMLRLAVTLILLGVLPWWSSLLGLRAFTARLLIMTAAIAPTTLVVGLLLTQLARAWYAAGARSPTQLSTKQLYPV